jgi:hypothetical protein
MNDLNSSYIICDICYNSILQNDENIHKIKCKEEQIELLKKFNIIENKIILTSSQENALKYAEKKSKIISKNVYLMVLAKYKYLGYTEDDLNKTIKYIQDKIPVIIHLDLTGVLKFLCNDTEYRNQFETGTSRVVYLKICAFNGKRPYLEDITIKVKDMKKLNMVH